jgi:hypothetical protein
MNTVVSYAFSDTITITILWRDHFFFFEKKVITITTSTHVQILQISPLNG